MFNTRKAAYLILIVICLGIALAVAGRLTGAPATKVFTEDGLAIRGYDPVAYFDQQKPVKGDPAFAAEWNEVTWHFASADNREKFMDDPEAFAPQYGGYCAWAIAAKGKLYSTHPDNWTVHEGKLYLNYDDNVQTKWEKDIPGFIKTGDERWPDVRAE